MFYRVQMSGLYAKYYKCFSLLQCDVGHKNEGARSVPEILVIIIKKKLMDLTFSVCCGRNQLHLSIHPVVSLCNASHAT